MNEQTAILVRYRLERAREALDEAKLLSESDHANTFVNRLYYACFYAVTGLLLLDGLSSSKHSGVRSLFHQQYVKTDKVDREWGLVYDRLFDNRQKGDYADLYRFSFPEVSGWFDDASRFVETIEAIINTVLDKK